MKRRVPVEGGGKAELRGGDFEKKKRERKYTKRGQYRMLFIMRCNREMELGAKWATLTSSRKLKKTVKQRWR